MNHSNNCIRGTKGEEEQVMKNIWEKIMTENFPGLVKEKTQFQEVRRDPNKRNPKRLTLRHVTIKMTKLKDRES